MDNNLSPTIQISKLSQLDEKLTLAKKAIDHIEICSTKIECELNSFVDGKILDTRAARQIGESIGHATSIRRTWLEPLRGLISELENLK